MKRPHAVADPSRHRLWPPYPGFDVAFAATWSDEPDGTYLLDEPIVVEASRKKDHHERSFSVANLYLEQIERAASKAERLDKNLGVIVCVVPDEVKQNCRPKSVIANPSDEGIDAKSKKARKRGQFELFDEYNREQYLLAPDFRRQIKARAMKLGVPLQIIQESTLRLSDDNAFGERGLTPLSDRMWNLGTAFYYKCGGKPWKLSSAREGVCYVGIAFRRSDEHGSTACCAAQMFLDSGDGVVFLGEYGPWYSTDTGQFHLKKEAAKGLLKGVLETYSQLDGKPLTEVFLHSRSEISKDEFDGYKEACPDSCKLTGIRVQSDRFGTRLFRGVGISGTVSMPVVRGTFRRVSHRTGYLYTSGFKPRLATYDGWETPVPLQIDIQHGNADITQVAQDILGLTKLNYNACRLGESKPVTVGFSDAVGEILISNPTVEERKPNFKFYI
ncbi:argonaute/piwi family protein [Aporhodopirellula aestuarii]|uniref:Piwi domain-containing protein n=1 Tax=Aporhodopirellula aestuarii TaxID=2950107 RepID=A0ABT0U5E9_9BACT|nr:hypothetical protein [Aporhodopirellula aestuarii]MCM2372090.1 hypothetical protein [Aporhodopirellula aestuarii]